MFATTEALSTYLCLSISLSIYLPTYLSVTYPFITHHLSI